MKQKLTIIVLSIFIFPFSVIAATPEALDDSAIVQADTTKTISVLTNDSDEDGDTLEIKSVTDGEHGTVRITSNKDMVEYKPDTGFNGTDTFEYTITDGSADATATVTVYVAPDAPTNFRINMELKDDEVVIDDISWDSVLDESLNYRLYVGISSGDYNEDDYVENFEEIREDFIFLGDMPLSYLVEEIQKFLPASTRYYVAITAVKYPGSPDELESDRSNELVVDIYPDEKNLPNQPTIVSARITGPAEATVTFVGNNDNMVDLKDYTIRYESPDGGTATLTLDKNRRSKEIRGLRLDTTYIFTVTASDYSGNDTPSEGVSLLIESTSTLLEDPELFSGGCFMTGSMNTKPSWPAVSISVFFLFSFLLICGFRSRMRIIGAAIFFLLSFGTIAHATDYKNTIGIKGGLLMSTDDSQKLYYDENEAWGLLYYDRDLSYYDLSAEFEIGYLKKTGCEATSSGAPTHTETDLMLVPIILSLKYNYTLLPLISVFIGGGLDYWFYKEENDDKEINAKDDGYGVGGYHGKAGVTLMTADEDWIDRSGVTLEFMYSKIDRFGKNEIDLGGMSFNISLFYKF